MLETIEQTPDPKQVQARADELFHRQRMALWVRTDRLFALLLVVQYVACVLLAWWLTPLTWVGGTSSIHLHLMAALVLNAVVVIPPIVLAWRCPGAAATRHVIAVAQMLESALLIHLTGGRIETHFHVFASLAALAYYRDWKPMLSATAVVAVDHFIRGVWYPQSVYGVLTASPYRWIEHAAWVLLEVGFLVHACRTGVNELRQLVDRQALLEAEGENRERINQVIRDQADRLRLSVTAGRLGLWDWDMASGEVHVSDEYYTMLGYEPGEFNVTFERWQRLVHPDDQAQAVASVNAAIEGTSDQHDAEVRLQRADGEWHWARALGEVVQRDADGRALRLVGLHLDIDRIKRVEHSLEEARDAAEAANLAKSEFLATMSHEIRTPLNGMMGMLDLLEDTSIDQQQGRYLRGAQVSAQSLLTLINDVLDLSKIEAKQLELDPKPFNLEQLMEDTMTVLTQRANEKGLELAYSITSDVEPELVGDETRVRQVLINLISNAIKFTHRGEVVVTVKAQHELSDQQVLCIEVRDTGIGIPAEKQERLFKIFSQVDSSMSRKYGGSGLGLAISKRLCELMGGTIGVESIENVGSRFWFTLTLGKSAQPTTPETERPLPAGMHGMRVLIVDDNTTSRELLVELTSHWGFHATATASAAEAMEAIEAAPQPFTVALVDMVMPGEDGLALCRRIRNEAQHRDMRLLLCNSQTEPPHAEQLRHAGCDGIIDKPIGPSRLFDAIIELVAKDNAKGNASTHDAPHRATPQPSPSPAPSSSDTEWTRGVRVLVAEDNEINQLVARDLLRSAGFKVQVVGDGAEAIDAVREAMYDLILMDCQMPEMDGFEATRRIGELAQSGAITRRPPIVALTANAMQGDRERCLAHGMDGYVSKPLDRAQLLDAIREALPHASDSVDIDAPAATGDNGRDASAPTSPAAAVPASPAAADRDEVDDVYDIDALFHRCMNNAALVERVLHSFGESAVNDLAVLTEAARAGDQEQVRVAAHKLKGGAAQVGAEHVSRLAAEIEAMSAEARLDEVDQPLDQLSQAVEVAAAARAKVLKQINEMST